jgi:hypothetical protein
MRRVGPFGPDTLRARLLGANEIEVKNVPAVKQIGAQQQT